MIVQTGAISVRNKSVFMIDLIVRRLEEVVYIMEILNRPLEMVYPMIRITMLFKIGMKQKMG